MTVTLVVFNDLSTDQRVHKIADTLTQNGYSVLVLGTHTKNSADIAPRNYLTYRIFRFFKKGKLAYLEFHIKSFFYLVFSKKVNILVANDLDTLAPVFFAAFLKGSRVIYDSHEHFTEVPELINRPFTRKIWNFLENLLAPRVNQIMTVNQPLAEILANKFKKYVSTVRNVPLFNKNEKQITTEKILIYQGAVNVGRGVELMIAAMKFLPEWKLWIVGGGDLEEQLKLKFSSDQICFFGKIPFENLSEITSKARIGLSLEENLGLNYRIATPNKVFDYVQMQIPVIISDLPGLKSLYNEFPIGEILYHRTPESLAEIVRKIDENIEKYTNELRRASEQWCWENESKELLKIYDGMKEKIN